MEFFTVAKLGWYAIAPSHLLVWLLIAVPLITARHRRIGIGLAAFCAGIVFLFLILPIGNWALRPIENQYARPAWPAKVDGVLFLGEGINGDIFSARGVLGVGQGGGNLIAADIIAERYPQARLIYSGGSDEAGDVGATQAASVEDLLQQMAATRDRVRYETKSRNTWENMAFSKALTKPEPGETWLLVASAYHMPRAMAVAKSLDWDVLPWPSDYLTAGTGVETHLSFSANLGHFDLAVHEWLGLVAYRWTRKAS